MGVEVVVVCLIVVASVVVVPVVLVAVESRVVVEAIERVVKDTVGAVLDIVDGCVSRDEVGVVCTVVVCLNVTG